MNNGITTEVMMKNKGIGERRELIGRRERGENDKQTERIEFREWGDGVEPGGRR